jgi:hypothetical protein
VRTLKAGPGKRHCPFAKKGYLDARALGKAAIEKMKKDPKLALNLVVEQVIQEYSP